MNTNPSNLNVLVIDDDADTRSLFQNLTADLGISLQLADSLQKAKQAIDKTTFDLVFLDLILDDARGRGFVRWYESLKDSRESQIIIISDTLTDRKPYFINGKPHPVLPKLQMNGETLKKLFDTFRKSNSPPPSLN